MLHDQLTWKTVTTVDHLPSDLNDPNVRVVRDKIPDFVNEGKTDGIGEQDQTENIITVTRYWATEAAANEWIAFIRANYPADRYLVVEVVQVV